MSVFVMSDNKGVQGSRVVSEIRQELGRNRLPVAVHTA